MLPHASNLTTLSAQIHKTPQQKRHEDKYTADINSHNVRERCHYTINRELLHIVCVI